MKQPMLWVLLSLTLVLQGCSNASPASKTELTAENYDEVSQKILAIRSAWYRGRPRADDDGQTYRDYLVVDTGVPALWLERGGEMVEDSKCSLPLGFQWEIFHATLAGRERLDSPVRLKQRSDASQEVITQEILWVHGFNDEDESGMSFTITDSGGGVSRGKVTDWQTSWPPKPDKPDAVDQSFIVTPEEYDAN